MKKMMNTTKQFQIYKRTEGTENYNDKMSDTTLIQLADKFGTISFYDCSDEELGNIEEQAKKTVSNYEFSRKAKKNGRCSKCGGKAVEKVF